MKTIFPLGLPRTGKTTFLPALYQTAATASLTPAMSLLKAEGDMVHILELVRRWRLGVEVNRTDQATEETVTLTLGLKGEEEGTKLVFPDNAGEDFRHWIQFRTCRVDQAELAHDALGMMLFIHPEKVTPIVSISDVNYSKPEEGEDETLDQANVAEIAGGKQAAEEQEDGDDSETSEDEPQGSFSPTEVVSTVASLVELVQCFAAMSAIRPLKVAVIISAWDLMPPRGPISTPDRYLKGELPGFHDFLRANQAWIKSSVFGVSATGGRLEDPGELANILDHENPVSRIKVVDQTGVAMHDLTEIVAWFTK